MTESVEDGFSQIETRLEALEVNINDLRMQLAENTVSITTLQTAVTELADIARLHQQALRISQQDAEADRALMRDQQLEIRHIWEYLLRQNPNGRGGQD